MSEEKKKQKPAIIPIILSAISAVLSFGFSFLVAKPLGPELYGQIEYYIGIISVTSILLAFGLPNFLNKETQFHSDKKKFFSNAVAIFSIISAIGIPIFLLIGYFLLGGLNKNIPLVFLIYIASICTSLSTLVASFYIGNKEPSKSIIFTTIIPHFVILVVSLVFLITKKEELPNYYLYISLLAYLIGVAPCLIKNVRRCKISMSKKDMSLILSFYAITLTSSIYSELSKILQGEINKNFSTVGILGVSIKIISIVSIFLGVISKITMPEFARYAKEKNYDKMITYYQKVTRVNSYVVIPFLLAIGIQGKKVLGIFGDEYTAHMWIFIFLVASSFINHVTGPTGTMLLMSEHEKYEIFNGVLKLVLYLAIGIPFGLNYVWGLPLAIFIADGLINFVKFFEVYHVTKKHPYTLKMVIQVLVLSAISSGVFFLLNLIDNFYVWIISNIVVGVVLILLFFILSPYKEDKEFVFKNHEED